MRKCPYSNLGVTMRRLKWWDVNFPMMLLEIIINKVYLINTKHKQGKLLNLGLIRKVKGYKEFLGKKRSRG